MHFFLPSLIDKMHQQILQYIAQGLLEQLCQMPGTLNLPLIAPLLPLDLPLSDSDQIDEEVLLVLQGVLLAEGGEEGVEGGE